MWVSIKACSILNLNTVTSLGVLAAGTNTAEEGAEDGENHEEELPPGAEVDGVAEEDESSCLCSWHQANQKKGTDRSYYRLLLHFGAHTSD